MKVMRVDNTQSVIIIFSITAIFILLISLFDYLFVPAVINYLELYFQKKLSFELSLRLHLAYVVMLVFLALSLAAFHPGIEDSRKRLLAFIFMVESLVLILILLIDNKVVFMSEDSALTVISMVVLMFAALFAFFNFIFGLSFLEGKRSILIFWLLLSFAFLFAGVDEYFTVHEKMGRWVNRFTEGGFRSFQDIVTMLYFLGAVGFVIFFYKLFRSEFIFKNRYFYILFFWPSAPMGCPRVSIPRILSCGAWGCRTIIHSSMWEIQ